MKIKVFALVAQQNGRALPGRRTRALLAYLPSLPICAVRRETLRLAVFL